jgi:signal transduction histidine kinase
MATDAAASYVEPEAQGLPNISRYLVGLRWALILLSVGLTLWFINQPLLRIPVHHGPVDPRLVALAMVACNVPLSIWILRQWPPSGAGRHWLVAADVAQAIVWTLLAGGSSFFFVLILPAVLHATMLYSWQTMLLMVPLLAMLRLLMTVPDLILGRTTIATLLAQPMALGMLLVGALLTMLSEQVRREQHGRRAAAVLAERNARLYALEQEQVQALQRFEAARSTFFSTVAHELKTPLTVLKTLSLSQLDLPNIPPAVLAEISEATDQNLLRLETLINDLLEVTRLEAAAITLRPHALDLAQHAERFVAGMRSPIQRKNRRLQLSLAPGLPPVWAEGKRVDQVLVNLVNNAVKFAPPASVVDLCVAPVGEHEVQVCVLDRGPGVPPDERDRIFEKFYTKSADKALAGLGLGLFICRELVRLHGGRIWLEDRDGGGSCFCFTLPRLREEGGDAQ